MASGYRFHTQSSKPTQHIDKSSRHNVPSKERPSEKSRIQKLTVIPVVQEKVVVGKRRVGKSRVRVNIVPEIRERVIDVPLVDEVVDVQRVPIGRIVDKPQPARNEGDTKSCSAIAQST